MSSDRVISNGVEMAAEWPVRIEAAQKIREYVIGGKAYGRIPYGAEEGGGKFPEPCHDCGVLRGHYHVEGVCDMEECVHCVTDRSSVASVPTKSMTAVMASS